MTRRWPWTAWRMVGREVLSWTLITVILVGGLATLVGAVEGAESGAAALAGIRQAPMIIVLLSPLCAIGGAALAAARLQSTGARGALEAAGIGPRLSGVAALAIGLALGTAAWVTHDRVIPSIESPGTRMPWVWVGDGAVRSADGLFVQTPPGAPPTLSSLPADRAAAVTQGRWLQRPVIAPSEALTDAPFPAAQAEHQGRLARVLACGLLAWLGWIGVGGTQARQIGGALVVGLLWQLAALTLGSGAAQGLWAPILGVTIPLIPLAVWIWRSRR